MQSYGSVQNLIKLFQTPDSPQQQQQQQDGGFCNVPRQRMSYSEGLGPQQDDVPPRNTGLEFNRSVSATADETSDPVTKVSQPLIKRMTRSGGIGFVDSAHKYSFRKKIEQQSATVSKQGSQSAKPVASGQVITTNRYPLSNGVPGEFSNQSSKHENSLTPVPVQASSTVPSQNKYRERIMYPSNGDDDLVNPHQTQTRNNDHITNHTRSLVRDNITSGNQQAGNSSAQGRNGLDIPSSGMRRAGSFNDLSLTGNHYQNGNFTSSSSPPKWNIRNQDTAYQYRSWYSQPVIRKSQSVQNLSMAPSPQQVTKAADSREEATGSPKIIVEYATGSLENSAQDETLCPIKPERQPEVQAIIRMMEGNASDGQQPDSGQNRRVTITVSGVISSKPVDAVSASKPLQESPSSAVRSQPVIIKRPEIQRASSPFRTEEGAERTPTLTRKKTHPLLSKMEMLSRSRFQQGGKASPLVLNGNKVEREAKTANETQSATMKNTGKSGFINILPNKGQHPVKQMSKAEWLHVSALDGADITSSESEVIEKQIVPSPVPKQYANKPIDSNDIQYVPSQVQKQYANKPFNSSDNQRVPSPVQKQYANKPFNFSDNQRVPSPVQKQYANKPFNSSDNQHVLSPVQKHYANKPLHSSNNHQENQNLNGISSHYSNSTTNKKTVQQNEIIQDLNIPKSMVDSSSLPVLQDGFVFTLPTRTPDGALVHGEAQLRKITDQTPYSKSTRSEWSHLPDHTTTGQGNENGDSNHGNGIIKSGIPPSIENEAAEDEKVQDRVTLRTWDPVGILKELYEIKLAQEDVDSACNMINMQGVMEKLPTNKKKATLLKTWKRRYFKLQDGHLYYYDESEPDPKNSACEKAQGFLKLMGGSIEELGGRIMGIDDGRGRYMVVRCSSDDSYAKWKAALETQIVDNIKTTYVKPVLNPSPHKTKKVVVVDIGSCSVRAGILGEQPSLPTLFFPCVVGLNKINKYRTFGFDAWRPDVRSRCTITYPVRPSVTIDKGGGGYKPFSIDMESMPGLFTKIFRELKVEPSQYWVMLSAPANFNDKIKSEFMKILVDQFQVPGINMVSQSLLSLYAYNATSGIVVDVGERLEIVPVTDGYMIEGGISRQTYGGHRVAEELNKYLLSDNKFRFFTDVEFNIVRSLMEKTCYVAENYSEELKKFSAEPESCLKSISLDTYDLPPDTWTHVEHDTSRFKSPEGLFNNDLWGMDNPSLQKLVHKAIQACPMDVRREMARSIYLSGGTTMLPGFPERLQAELTKVLPSSLVIQVHALPQRYHAAFIGACVMASHPAFERACITAAEWKKEGLKSLRKWQNF